MVERSQGVGGVPQRAPPTCGTVVSSRGPIRVRVELHGLEGRVPLPVQAVLLALGEGAVLPLHEAV